ncbi:hypothetical protein BKA69DRAFT_1123567 [Paraphysoderma sedebokerense]|nr:hypothetical protein BKA69DRAFT_1123567 [Paraphysoderma sedebokerense]
MGERGRGRGRGAYYKAKYGNKRNRSDSQSSVNENDRDDISADRNNFNDSADHDMPLPYLKSHDLHTMLTQIEGQSYGSYKRIKGSYLFPSSQITLIVDQVQGDAYASPSRLRARIPMTAAGFPPDTYSNRIRAIALADVLTREFYDGLHSRKLDFKPSHDSWKAANGGHITIDKPSQNVLYRSTVVINPQYIEVRFTFGLPAQGRSIMGFYCAELLVEQLPEVLEKSFYYNSLNKDKLQSWVDCVEDQEYLRGQVNSQGFIAFIPNGAILPRQSGASDIPLPNTSAVKWQSPQSLERSFNLIHGGTITGTVIPRGVTLIVGGGFHGKSTLLKAIEMGIYPKIPGDGREYLVGDGNIVKVRAEDGRNVSAVDITPFITNLPYGKDTSSFSTPDASGSTSMAAGIQEALEIGATGLLFDEDTSATNFLVRDIRMQALIHKNNEPITPLIYKARQLFEEKSVSSILVIGGCGDYLDIADTVICMEHYVPKDYTFRAKEIMKMIH